MKKLLLLLLGLLPLAFGYGLNALMLGACYDVALPYGWIGVGMLAVWFLFGMLSRPLGDSAFQAVLVAHVPALIALALLLYQEWFLGRCWLNVFGMATQMFYLPLVNLAAKIAFFASAMPAMGPPNRT